MKLKHILYCLLPLAPVILSAADEKHYELYEYDGVLEIEIPYKKVLLSERFQARLKIINRGKETIKVTGKGNNTDTQLVWIPWKDGKAVESSGSLLLGSYKKSPIDAFNDISLYSYTSGTIDLKPGKTYEHERMRVKFPDGSLYPIRRTWGEGELELRPALYGGKGKVIYGKPFKIKFIPKSVSSFKKVFETTYTTSGGGQNPFDVHEIPIDGEIYLFNRHGVRFCRVPPGVEYTFNYKQEGRDRFLTVNFDDQTLKPHIFNCRMYELVSASHETIPWLFDKPEGYTGFEKITPEKPGNNKYTDRNAAPTSDAEKSSVDDKEKSSKAWIVASLLLVIGVIIFMVIRKKKEA